VVSFSGLNPEQLDKIDRDIIDMWLSGLSLRKISKFLGISHMTVKRKLDKYMKMGLEVVYN